MHPVNLIASGLSVDDSDYPIMGLQLSHGICAVTGIESQCVPRKSLLGKSFCDGETLVAPSSDMVSIDAYIALKYKWERMSSWTCNEDEFKKLTRIEVRATVFACKHKLPWCGYVTTSYKKHGALRAPINYLNGQNKWLFESRIVNCSDNAKMLQWWDILNIALKLGISRSIMESLSCPFIVMQKIGLTKWIEFETWARSKINNSLYAFLVYLLPSQEELKDEKRKELKDEKKDENDGMEFTCQIPLI